MPSIRDYPATFVAVLLSVLSVAYVVLTPTNILLSLFPVLLFLGLGLLMDLVSISPGPPRQYPATLVALSFAVAVAIYTVLTAAPLFLGSLVTVQVVVVAVLYDLAPISLRSPRQCRATVVTIPIVLLFGVYTLLTPTNVLLWFLGAVPLIGLGILVDWMLAR